MTAKLVLVLGYLSLIAVTLVSWPVIREVCTGFVSFGTVPLRAQSIILERHFTLQERQGTTLYRVSGTWEKDGLPTGDLFVVIDGDRTARFNLRKSDASLPRPWPSATVCSIEPAPSRCPAIFSSRPIPDSAVLSAEGEIVDHHLWEPAHLTVRDSERPPRLRHACRGSRALLGDLPQLARA